jgi:predicted TIM-barrel fold metal-dependent hydrolase
MMYTERVEPPAVIDAFVTPVFWRREDAPAWVRDTVEGVFGQGEDAFRSREPDELVAEMDAAGVAVAVLNALAGTVTEVTGFLRRHPGRFLLSAELDPRTGMHAVRELERLVREEDLRLVRMVPFAVGLAPDDRVYYPIYAKAVELGVPVSVTCGIPGAPMPAEVQRPLHLDEVCRFFPDLTLIMAHGADPWWGEAIRLLRNHPNLYMMTSAWAPRRLPDELVRFMGRRRGRGKVMFATDYPVLSFARCVPEARGLALAPEARDDYLHGNAARVLRARSDESE